MADLRILAAAMLACLPCPAFAFERCDDIFNEPQDLAAFLYQRGVHDGPVRFFESAGRSASRPARPPAA